MGKKVKYIYMVFICLFIFMFHVNADADVIKLDKNQLTLGIGYYETLRYSLATGLNSSNIIWTSSNEKVATVQNGKVIAITEGSTIITATINGNKSTCKVNVSSNYIPVKGVSLNKSNLDILLGASEQLIETIIPIDATNRDVIWTSSNEEVVTVENGNVVAKKLGFAIITASISGFKSTCRVNVVDVIPLKSISINKSNIVIKENSYENLIISYSPSNATNKKVTWKSSNPNIVTVDQQGNITGVNPGSATVTAISNDGGYVSMCNVTVEAISKNIIGIDLDKKELSIVSGKKEKLNVIINPSYAENKNITWISSNEEVATVDNGEVNAISPGTTEIKAISEDGEKEAICKVTVTSPIVESLSFTNEEQTVYVNSRTKLNTILEPENSNIENLIWTSSNEEVATVENGIVNAISIGETTVSVFNEENTINASIKVIVVDEPEEELNITIEGYNLNFDPEIKNYTLKIGSEDKLKIDTNISEKKVTINGNKNLKDGSIITITVANKEKITYVINIKKKGNYTIYFIAIISFLLFINLIRLAIKGKKK